MYNVLEFNNDFKKMYKTSLVKLYGEKIWLNSKIFEIGSIDGTTGENSYSENRIRLKGYLNVKPNSKYLIKANIIGNIGLRFYDKDKKYIQHAIIFNNKRVIFDTPKNCYYIRFVDETKDIDYIRIIFEPLLLQQNLKIDLTFEQGSINYSTGQNQSLASTLRTDFIEVQENETYKLRYYNSNIVYGLRCYDKDKHYLKPDEINSNIITIPTGTRYIRLIRKDTSKPVEFLERI